MTREADAGATYELAIGGELDARYAVLFEGMEMERAEGVTVIRGRVRDKAQLYGFIERIEDLGLELLSVQKGDGA